MKTFMLLATCGITMAATQACAQVAPNIDVGTYYLTLVVTGATANCTLQAGATSFGYMDYPGPNKAGFQISLPSFVAPANVNVIAGPNVPAGGLNAWTLKVPGAGTFTSFTNGVVVNGPVADMIAITLTAVGKHLAQGSINLSQAACTQSYAVTAVFTGK